VAPYQDRGNRYLPVLGSIVELVADPAVREKMLAIEDFDQLTAILDQGT